MNTRKYKYLGFQSCWQRVRSWSDVVHRRVVHWPWRVVAEKQALLFLRNTLLLLRVSLAFLRRANFCRSLAALRISDRVMDLVCSRPRNLSVIDLAQVLRNVHLGCVMLNVSDEPMRCHDCHQTHLLRRLSSAGTNICTRGGPFFRAGLVLDG